MKNARRSAGHEFVFRLDLAADHDLTEAMLDQGERSDSPDAATMSPVRDFSLAVSATGTDDQDFREVVRGMLPRAASPRTFVLPAGTPGRYAAFV